MGSAEVPADPHRALVEGPFKQFRFRAITPEDYDNVCANVRQHFVQDEMTGRMLGVDEAYANEFDAVVRVALDQNMNFLAEDVATGEIAGLRLNIIQPKDVNVFAHLKFETRQMRILFQIFGELDKQADIFNKYGVNEYGFFFLASTTPKYRNNGLAKEFYTRMLGYFKAHGMKVLKVFTSSPFTGAATKSVGFDIAGRIDLREYVDTDTGEKAFKDKMHELTDEHQLFVKLYQL